jgi:hypothetical protein
VHFKRKYHFHGLLRTLKGCSFTFEISRMLQVGKIYRLKFPGIAARILKAPAGLAPTDYPFLVESLFLRIRWYVNDRGEPTHLNCPQLMLPKTRPRTKGDDRVPPAMTSSEA